MCTIVGEPVMTEDFTLMVSPAARTPDADTAIVPEDVVPSIQVWAVLVMAQALNPPVLAGNVALSMSVFVSPEHVPDVKVEQCHFSLSAEGVPASARLRISI